MASSIINSDDGSVSGTTGLKTTGGDDGELAFESSGTEAMRIDSSGNVGIGTSSPTSRLHVNNSTASTNSIAQFTNGTTGSSAGNGLYVGIDTSNEATVFNFYNSALKLGTNGTERMRIDSSGNVGIGASSPTATLDIERATGTVELQLQSRDSSDTFISFGDNDDGDVGQIKYAHSDNSMRFTTNASERMRIDSSGVVWNRSEGTSVVAATNAASTSGVVVLGVRHSASGITTGTDCFYVMANGDAKNTNNAYGAISDLKLKENVVDANSQWDDLKALQVRNYNFKPETNQQTHTQIGLIAQEAELVSPGLVSESPDRDEDGNDLGTVTKSVNYSVLYMKAVKTLQEAMTRIETLEAEVAALKAN